jgi:hypothetical protein
LRSCRLTRTGSIQNQTELAARWVSAGLFNAWRRASYVGVDARLGCAGLKSCSSVSAERVTGQRFGMNGTLQLANFHPDRGVVYCERKLAFEEQTLGYLVGDAGHIISEHPDLQAPFIQLKSPSASSDPQASCP